jgi:hypothetical protein
MLTVDPASRPTPLPGKRREVPAETAGDETGEIVEAEIRHGRPLVGGEPDPTARDTRRRTDERVATILHRPGLR